MKPDVAITGLRSFILFTSLYWFACGTYFFINPEAMEYAGYEIKHWAALTEARSMYGGLEISLAVFCLLGFLKPQSYFKQSLILNTRLQRLMVKHLSTDYTVGRWRELLMLPMPPWQVSAFSFICALKKCRLRTSCRALARYLP